MNCRTCIRGQPGKPQYNDPNWWCVPGSLSDKKWEQARKWKWDLGENGHVPEDASGCPHYKEKAHD